MRFNTPIQNILSPFFNLQPVFTQREQKRRHFLSSLARLALERCRKRINISSFFTLYDPRALFTLSASDDKLPFDIVLEKKK
jgi:hypothetical protein